MSNNHPAEQYWSEADSSSHALNHSSLNCSSHQHHHQQQQLTPQPGQLPNPPSPLQYRLPSFSSSFESMSSVTHRISNTVSGGADDCDRNPESINRTPDAHHQQSTDDNLTTIVESSSSSTPDIASRRNAGISTSINNFAVDSDTLQSDNSSWDAQRSLVVESTPKTYRHDSSSGADFSAPPSIREQHQRYIHLQPHSVSSRHSLMMTTPLPTLDSRKLLPDFSLSTGDARDVVSGRKNAQGSAATCQEEEEEEEEAITEEPVDISDSSGYYAPRCPPRATRVLQSMNSSRPARLFTITTNNNNNVSTVRRESSYFTDIDLDKANFSSVVLENDRNLLSGRCYIDGSRHNDPNMLADSQTSSSEKWATANSFSAADNLSMTGASDGLTSIHSNQSRAFGCQDDVVKPPLVTGLVKPSKLDVIEEFADASGNFCTSQSATGLDKPLDSRSAFSVEQLASPGTAYQSSSMMHARNTTGSFKDTMPVEKVLEKIDEVMLDPIGKDCSQSEGDDMFDSAVSNESEDSEDDYNDDDEDSFSQVNDVGNMFDEYRGVSTSRNLVSSIWVGDALTRPADGNLVEDLTIPETTDSTDAHASKVTGVIRDQTDSSDDEMLRSYHVVMHHGDNLSDGDEKTQRHSDVIDDDDDAIAQHSNDDGVSTPLQEASSGMTTNEGNICDRKSPVAASMIKVGDISFADISSIVNSTSGSGLNNMTQSGAPEDQRNASASCKDETVVMTVLETIGQFRKTEPATSADQDANDVITIVDTDSDEEEEDDETDDTDDYDDEFDDEANDKCDGSAVAQDLLGRVVIVDGCQDAAIFDGERNVDCSELATLIKTTVNINKSPHEDCRDEQEAIDLSIHTATTNIEAQDRELNQSVAHGNLTETNVEYSLLAGVSTSSPKRTNAIPANVVLESKRSLQVQDAGECDGSNERSVPAGIADGRELSRKRPHLMANHLEWGSPIAGGGNRKTSVESTTARKQKHSTILTKLISQYPPEHVDAVEKAAEICEDKLEKYVLQTPTGKLRALSELDNSGIGDKMPENGKDQELGTSRRDYVEPASVLNSTLFTHGILADTSVISADEFTEKMMKSAAAENESHCAESKGDAAIVVLDAELKLMQTNGLGDNGVDDCGRRVNMCENENLKPLIIRVGGGFPTEANSSGILVDYLADGYVAEKPQVNASTAEEAVTDNATLVDDTSGHEVISPAKTERVRTDTESALPSARSASTSPANRSVDVEGRNDDHTFVASKSTTLIASPGGAIPIARRTRTRKDVLKTSSKQKARKKSSKMTAAKKTKRNTKAKQSSATKVVRKPVTRLVLANVQPESHETAKLVTKVKSPEKPLRSRKAAAGSRIAVSKSKRQLRNHETVQAPTDTSMQLYSKAIANRKQSRQHDPLAQAQPSEVFLRTRQSVSKRVLPTVVQRTCKQSKVNINDLLITEIESCDMHTARVKIVAKPATAKPTKISGKSKTSRKTLATGKKPVKIGASKAEVQAVSPVKTRARNVAVDTNSNISNKTTEHTKLKAQSKTVAKSMKPVTRNNAQRNASGVVKPTSDGCVSKKTEKNKKNKNKLAVNASGSGKPTVKLDNSPGSTVAKRLRSNTQTKPTAASTGKTVTADSTRLTRRGK